MMKTISAAVAVCILASGCSNKTEEAPKAPPVKGTFTISSPVVFSKDPVEKKRQNAEMVDSMIRDARMPLDMIEGEAFRRGIQLTPEQIALKKSQNVKPIR